MQKIGSQTIKFDNPPTILDTACIVGPKEADGPLAKYFDQCLDDEFWGEKSWEKAESKIIKETVNTALTKSKLASDTIDFCFAGDLLNQCISSSFGTTNFHTSRRQRTAIRNKVDTRNLTTQTIQQVRVTCIQQRFRVNGLTGISQ